MALDCLVINLTRFGDLLQSQPLLHALHAQGLHTGLLCLRNFADTIPLLNHVEASWTLRGAHILSTLKQNWQLACKELLLFSHEIQNEAKPKYIINLTATIAARLLAKLLAGPNGQILGFGLDSDGFGVNFGAWSTFLSGTTSCRQNAVFNIVDMFRAIASPLLKNQVWVERRGFKHQETAIDQLLSLPDETQGLVALQLGASEERRMWPTSYFARLGDYLWAEHKLLPVLTGSASEEPLGAAYAKAAEQPFLNLLGKTSLKILAALLTKTRLLISNDTGTMHLAAGLGTPCLGFFLSTAQPWDTAPYLKDCLCLEPDMSCHPCQFQTVCPHDFQCRWQITPEAVALLVNSYFKTGKWQTPSTSYPIRIWRTTIDQEGWAAIECMSQHDTEDRTLFIQHQRNFWRQFLDELQSGSSQRVSKHYLPCSEAFRARTVPILKQVINITHLLQEQGVLLGSHPLAGKLFLRNCDRVQTLLTTNQNLVSLGLFWRELRQDQAQNLPALLAAIKLFGQHLQRFCCSLEGGTECA
ncbi:MAG: glycosyltransferase family 9 protein [Desulfovibrionaceae bacterium]|nr:glycosyltransferase family 9 protein [Desulfovibrionaceae bacterium]